MQENNIIVWVYSQWKWDFGFIDVEWIEKWYYVFWKNKNWAFDWDKVEAQVKIFKQKKEAQIVKIIERKQDLIVWEYQDNKNFGFVIPKNKQIDVHIFIPWRKSMNAKTWDIVWVLIKNWKKKKPEWEIKEILWKKGDKNIDLDWIIVEWWAKINFWEKVLSYVKKLKNPLSKEFLEKSRKWDSYQVKKINKRKNLRNLFTFTIDWEDAKDLDDAISIEEVEFWEYSKNNSSQFPFNKGRGNMYKLYVHIADVSHYVKEKSVLDVEAYKRATSTYLVDRVIPMLPEKLSNDLCSLNPNTDKLTLTCEMIIDKNGNILDQFVYESIINSDFRLTYKEVDEILWWKINIWDKLLFWWIVSKNLVEKLELSNNLKEKIKNFREKTWVINFEFVETKIKLDKDWNPIKIEKYPRYDSNKMIEEFMISANQAVSKKFSKFPFLYRIHEEPKEEDLISLQEKLNLFEIDFQFKNWDTKEFSILLEKIEKYEESKKIFLHSMILRTLSKAVYSKENFWHFGLWLSFYSHFTSPIRRYPDLQIHRIIKEKIARKLDKKRIFYYNNILEKVWKHTSDKERKAEKLEYKVKDYFIVKYYKNKLWEKFEWVISWVILKWFFVLFDDGAEWFVELSNSDFLESLQEHKDLKTWEKYRLWDRVKIKLIEVDENLLRLNFEII